MNRRDFLGAGLGLASTSLIAGSAGAVQGRRQFPCGFLWGTATAARQVEGNMDCMDQRTTRALPPSMSFSTSARVAMDVSPGVVMARAPWAAP